jgi:hypothetical protein
MESWVGSKHVVFCSGYNASTHFWNLQRRSLTCMERGPLQKMSSTCTVMICVS